MAKTKKYNSYTFKRNDDGTYRAIKMTLEGDVLEVYKISKSRTHCSCPAHIPYCRHKQMLNIFEDANKVGSGWRLVHETGEWLEPQKIDKPGGLYEGLFEDEAEPEIPSHLIDI
jgi:hypothetical protein